MKITVVEFTEKGARIRVGIENPKPASNILINPELPKGVPPHLWRLVDGAIVVVDEATHALEMTAPKPVCDKQRDHSLLIAIGISLIVSFVTLIVG